MPDAEVSCTTERWPGQMVAQLAANRRCYLRIRCTQAQRPSNSQDVTYPQIEIDMWAPARQRDYSFWSAADWTIRVYSDRTVPGPAVHLLKLYFIASLKWSYHPPTSLSSFSKSQLSSIQSDSLKQQICSQHVHVQQCRGKYYNERRVESITLFKQQ